MWLLQTQHHHPTTSTTSLSFLLPHFFFSKTSFSSLHPPPPSPESNQGFYSNRHPAGWEVTWAPAKRGKKKPHYGRHFYHTHTHTHTHTGRRGFGYRSKQPVWSRQGRFWGESELEVLSVTGGVGFPNLSDSPSDASEAARIPAPNRPETSPPHRLPPFIKLKIAAAAGFIVSFSGSFWFFLFCFVFFYLTHNQRGGTRGGQWRGGRGEKGVQRWERSVCVCVCACVCVSEMP